MVTRSTPRARRRCPSTTAGLLAITIAASSFTVGGQGGVESLDSWVLARALQIDTTELAGDQSDMRRLSQLVGSARVVALGEPAHGAHEPLAFRNKLFRYLVEERGFTAIAIESGLPESRRIDEFVAGGPGEVEGVVRDGLTFRFDRFRENHELVQWMRAYNANRANSRKIRFYGIDLSLGGPTGGTPTPVALQMALSYVARVDTENATRLRQTLEPFLTRLPTATAQSFSRAEHDTMTAAIDDLISLLERERPAFVMATSTADYEWAHHVARVAQQGDRMFRLEPPDPPGGGVPPTAWQAVNVRDAAMAENARWALAREGPDGRVLLFAHNAHVMNAAAQGGDWSVYERPPNAMGVHLRAALGNDLVIIGSSAEKNGTGLPAASPDPMSIDAALARVGLRRFIVDLRAAPDGARPVWVAQRHTLRANFTLRMTVIPGAAFDAFLFIETLTPARTG